MNTTDTLNLIGTPFYQWDSIIAHQKEEPQYAGVAMIDSVFAPRGTNEVHYRPSIFTDHSFTPQSSTLTQRYKGDFSAGIFAILLILVALTTYYIRSHNFSAKDLITSLVSARNMDRMLRNSNILRPPQLMPAALLVVACVAMMFLQTISGSTSIVVYLLLWAALSLAYFFRNGIVRLLGNIFDSQASINLYLTNNYIYHIVLSICLLPMLFLLMYYPTHTPTLFYVMVGLVTIEFLMRAIRGLQLFLTHTTGSHFYLFYYLCIVELAPILAIIKWIFG